jgi:hypothetical protein
MSIQALSNGGYIRELAQQYNPATISGYKYQQEIYNSAKHKVEE